MLSIDLISEGLESFKLDIDLKNILDEASEILVKSILTRFESEKDPDGKNWIPSRAGMLRKLNGGHGTLYDTGNLFRSIKATAPSDTSRRISYGMSYGDKFQLGTGGMIKRKFMGASQQDISMVNQVIESKLGKLLK